MLDVKIRSRITDISNRFRRIPMPWRSIGFLVFVFLVIFYTTLYRAPAEFPVNEIIPVPEGSTADEIAHVLAEKRVIRSPSLVKGILMLLGGERNIIAGDYIFNAKVGAGGAVSRLLLGDFGLEPIWVRLPEGATAEEMGRILSSEITNFDAEKFISLAEEKEGYLFPDTYQFYPNTEPDDVVKQLEETFDMRIADIRAEVLRFSRPLHEVITMASLIEKEAYLPETRRIISGILWKRLDEGIPLQVDAVFLYINGKNTFELTIDDLDTDSLYNTYRYRGLPPGPIANPSLDSILAAIEPIETEYYYYLADREGITYYSRTFEEHKEKKLQYLN